MYDIVEGIHRAFRIESTWAFVLLIALGTGAVGGFLAWVIDIGYKNSPEYKAEHNPKQTAVAPQESEPNAGATANKATTTKTNPGPSHDVPAAWNVFIFQKTPDGHGNEVTMWGVMPPKAVSVPLELELKFTSSILGEPRLGLSGYSIKEPLAPISWSVLYHQDKILRLKISDPPLRADTILVVLTTSANDVAMGVTCLQCKYE